MLLQVPACAQHHAFARGASGAEPDLQRRAALGLVEQGIADGARQCVAGHARHGPLHQGVDLLHRPCAEQVAALHDGLIRRQPPRGSPARIQLAISHGTASRHGLGNVRPTSSATAP